MTALRHLLADPALAPILTALPHARLVGGCVRDTLAGLPVADIDLATPDLPEQALRALQAAGLRVIPTGLAHGTLTAISGGRPFEVTTLRRDEETDGRHARVAWTDSFEEDAARRDFTINAMSLDQAGTLHDPFGGQADLASRRVRFVGEASRRIAEDYLRILRFFRFYARYAGGPPDKAAAAAIAAATHGLARLSAERVWSELKRILVTRQPLGAVTLMHRLGVLAAVLPDACDTAHLGRLLAAGAPPDPILRLAALLTGTPAPLADRLRLSAAEREQLQALTQPPRPHPDDDDATLRRLLADTPREVLAGRIWLDGGPESLRRRLEDQRRPVFPLQGKHALSLGAQPGPLVGEALRSVRDWWLQGGCVADEAACLARLGEVLGG